MGELVVLVPVLNRPENVAPLVDSFLENCPEGSGLYFLVEATDDEEFAAIVDVHLEGSIFPVPTSDWRTWPEKINWGMSLVKADWYLCAADDVRFIPGWWEATS